VNAKREAGFQLDRVQNNLDPENWKPMKTIGAGVRKIRIRCADGAYRVVYTAKLGNTFMCFMPSRKRRRKRYSERLNWRRSGSR